MRTLAFILSCAIISLGLLGCQQSTEQEKLVQAIKENSEIVKEWEQKLIEIGTKSQLAAIQHKDLPTSLQKIIPSSPSKSYYQIDLNLDNTFEIVTLDYTQTKGQLSIYYIDTNGQITITQTPYLSYFTKGDKTLSALPGLLKWVSRPDPMTTHRLDIRYENDTKGFRIIHCSTEQKQIVEGETTSYDLVANFITGKMTETCRTWIDDTPATVIHTVNIMQLPKLEQLSDSFIKKLTPKESCQGEDF